MLFRRWRLGGNEQLSPSTTLAYSASQVFTGIEDRGTIVHTVHLGALASHSRYYRERPIGWGLAWQREAASPSRLHSLQTRVWHPWTRSEALPLRHRSRAIRAPENQRRGAIAPLRPLARTIASRHPLVRAFGLRHLTRRAEEPRNGGIAPATPSGASWPARQGRGRDPQTMREHPDPVCHDRGCKSPSGPGHQKDRSST